MSKHPWYIKIIGEKEFIYHAFYFDLPVLKQVYPGDYFVGYNHDEELQYLKPVERIVDAGIDGFTPHLVTELKSIIGHGYYHYDGYELGHDEFSHYFFIAKEVYTQSLEKVKQWAEFKEISHLMSWTERYLI